MIARLRRLLIGRTSEDTVVYECRECGTTLDAPTDTCPQCDADAVAKYDL